MKKKYYAFAFLSVIILFFIYEYMTMPEYMPGRDTVKLVSADGRYQLDGGDPLFCLQDVKNVVSLDNCVFAYKSSPQVGKIYVYGAAGFTIICDNGDIFRYVIEKGDDWPIWSLKGHQNCHQCLNKYYGDKYIEVESFKVFSDFDRHELCSLVEKGEPQRQKTLDYLRMLSGFDKKNYFIHLQKGESTKAELRSYSELQKVLDNENLFKPDVKKL